MNSLAPSRGWGVPKALHLVGLALLVGVGYLAWESCWEWHIRQQFFDDRANAVIRTQAVEAWVRLGSVAVPEMNAALTSSKMRVRRDACLALNRLGALGKAASPNVRRCLEDPESQVRNQAAATLVVIDPLNPDTAAALTALLSDAAPDVREVALSGLLELGDRAIPAVLERLERFPDRGVAPALTILRRKGRTHPGSIPAMRRYVDDPDPDCRAAAVYGICQHRAAAPEELDTWLRDENEQVVLAALSTLPVSSADSSRHFEALRHVVRTCGDGLLRSVLRYIRQLGPAIEPIVADLQMRLGKNDSGLVDAEIVETLLEVSHDHQSLLALLESLSSTRDWHTVRASNQGLRLVSPDRARARAIELAQQLPQADREQSRRLLAAIAGLGPLAEPAVAAVIPLANRDAPWPLQDEAIEALGQIGPGAREAVPVLAEWLEATGSQEHRVILAIQALGRIGNAAAGSASRLLDLSASSIDPGFVPAMSNPHSALSRRCFALLAAVRVGAEEDDVSLVLQGSLNDSAPEVRAAAIYTIGESAALRERFSAELRLALQDPNCHVRAEAISQLIRETVVPTAEIAMIAQLLFDSDSRTRLTTIVALGRLGPAAQAAVPLLRESLAHEGSYPIGQDLMVTDSRDPLASLRVSLDSEAEGLTLAQAAEMALLRIEGHATAREPTPVVSRAREH